MALTREEVKNIAKLARVFLREDEVQKFTYQLTDILAYVNMLDELKDKLEKGKVEPTFQVTGLTNIVDNDEVERFDKVDKLLASSSLPKAQNQILVKKVL